MAIDTAARSAAKSPGHSRTAFRQLGRDVWRDRQLYILLAPAIIWLIIFHYIPIYGIQIAFRDYTPGLAIDQAKWVGLKYFKIYLNSPLFWPMIRNTLTLSVYGIVAGFPLPILFALMLNELKSERYKKIVQTVTYAPNFISTVVLCGMIILFFNPSYGPIVLFLKQLGVDIGNILISKTAFKHLYVWSGVWQGTGWSCIIYLSALSGVDPALHEAALIDGATRMQRIWHINIPMILPTIMITLIMSCGGILGTSFEKIYMLQNDMNLEVSRVISTYTYEQGLLGGKYSLTTAIGLFNTVINFFVLVTVNWISRKTTEISFL